jgi:hypothetical protein
MNGRGWAIGAGVHALRSSFTFGRAAVLPTHTPAFLRELRHDADVMFAARDHGLEQFLDIECAVLARNGDISIIPKRDR